MKNSSQLQAVPGDRLLSLDFFRGLTMFLLIAESTELYDYLVDPAIGSSIVQFIGTQFHHHPWNGLRFWDHIQPFFMFIVGVAIPLSIDKRIKKGQTRSQLIRHAVSRSLLLLLFGWGLYCVSAGKIVFRFQNVLAQLSVTYLISFLLVRKSFSTQLIVSFALLVVTEVIYRVFWVEGFNHPFVADQNFGAWLDLQYGGEDLRGHWVSFNAVPTTAHTIWGALSGKLLLSSRKEGEKFRILMAAGIILLALGYGLSYVTPIIKRIATSTFVLASGGWTVIALAISYWVIDIRKYRKPVLFFAIVGMNPLFIYLFAHVGGSRFLERIVHPFTMVLFGWTGTISAEILTSLVVLFLLWYICYWLYQKKIFIRI